MTLVDAAIFGQRAGRYGGELGGPVFKRVMTYALQARQVPPTGTTAPRTLITPCREGGIIGTGGRRCRAAAPRS